MPGEEGSGPREEARREGERRRAGSLEGWRRVPRRHRSPVLGGCTPYPEGRGEEASWGPSPRRTPEGEKRRDRACRPGSTGICKNRRWLQAGPRAPTLTDSGRGEAGRSLRTKSELGDCGERGQGSRRAEEEGGGRGRGSEEFNRGKPRGGKRRKTKKGRGRNGKIGERETKGREEGECGRRRGSTAARRGGGTQKGRGGGESEKPRGEGLALSK